MRKIQRFILAAALFCGAFATKSIAQPDIIVVEDLPHYTGEYSQMFNQYKVLSSMLELREFTISELSRCSGVDPYMASTVVYNRSEFIESVKSTERTFRLKPNAVAVLEAILATRYSYLLRYTAGLSSGTTDLAYQDSCHFQKRNELAKPVLAIGTIQYQRAYSGDGLVGSTACRALVESIVQNSDKGRSTTDPHLWARFRATGIHYAPDPRINELRGFTAAGVAIDASTIGQIQRTFQSWQL